MRKYRKKIIFLKKIKILLRGKSIITNKKNIIKNKIIEDERIEK